MGSRVENVHRKLCQPDHIFVLKPYFYQQGNELDSLDLHCIKTKVYYHALLLSATTPSSAHPGTPWCREDAARAPPGRKAGTVPHCVQGAIAGADHCQDQKEDWP